MVRYSAKCLLWITLSIFFSSKTLGQNVDLSPKTEEYKAEGQTLKGYSLTFDFTKKEIFKAWWKYSREFSRNETKKSEIKHTIPPKEGESTVPILFYSKVESPDSLSAKITAALNDNGMTSDNIEKYSKQIKELLIEFKVYYYKNNLQRKISETEKLAGKVGKSLDRYTSQEIKLTQKLSSNKEEKLERQRGIVENDSMIVILSRELTLNAQKRDSVSLKLEEVQQRLEELRGKIGRIR